MNIITDRQIAWNGGPFSNQYDTIKVFEEGRKFYKHGDETFAIKSALRRALSSEYGGAWIEEKDAKKRYFVDESGWFKRSIREVSKEEFTQKLETPSTWQKVLGIGLGVLALAPGVCEFARRIPFGAKEAGISLLALQQKSPLLGALGYSLLPEGADAQAMGTEFQVNTNTTNNQLNPSIAPLSDGGFVVTWQSTGQDGDLYGIYGQRYNAAGAPNGTEFQVNTYTTSNQQDPSVSLLNDGGLVFTWQSAGQDGDSWGIFGQRYNSTGAPNGAEFQVNTYWASFQSKPNIAPLNDGGFVVTWHSDGQDGDFDGIYAQRYDAAGAPSGTEFQVNTYWASFQVSPSVAPLNDGGFVVTWESQGQDGSSYGIYGQRYNTTGAPNGTEFQVNTYWASSQRQPSVAPLNDGGFVVSWVSDGQDGNLTGIYGQRYNATSAPNGLEFQVNTYTTSNQREPSIAPLNDGGFVDTWESQGQDGDSWGIYGQRYNPTGAPNGTEFQVNAYTTSRQEHPSVAPLNDGGFVVTWMSLGQDGNGYGIYGQRYDSNGTAIPLSDPLSDLPSTSSNGGTTNVPSSPLSLTASSSGSSTLSLLSSSTSGEQSNGLSTATSQLSSMSSSALPSSMQSSSTSPLSSSTSGMESTPQTSNALSSSPSGFVIPVLIDIVYGESYSIIQNGQTIGTYIVSGGNGLFDASNSNVLTIQLDPSYAPEDGDTLTLFSFSEGQEGFVDNLIIEGMDYECLVADGNSSENNLEYQIIFEEANSCATTAPQILTSVIAMATN